MMKRKAVKRKTEEIGRRMGIGGKAGINEVKEEAR